MRNGKSVAPFICAAFVEPGNRLRFNESINRGIIHIEEEKTYHLTYTLADAFGNTTRLSVWIEGKEQEIPEIETEGTELFHWMADNRFGAKRYPDDDPERKPVRRSLFPLFGKRRQHGIGRHAHPA